MFWDLQPDAQASAAGVTAVAPRWGRLSATVHTWGSRAVLSILDQGVLSGANFVLNLVLARALEPPQYGAFSLAFVIFLFIAGFQNALILEPMAVLGPTRRDQAARDYLVAMSRISMAVSAGGSLVVAFAAAATTGNNRALSIALMGLALSLPFILSHWYLRRACYIQTRPGLALESSALYALIILGGALGCVMGRRVSPFWAFVLMGVGSAVASLRACLGLGLHRLAFCPVICGHEERRLFRQHWAYGKWALATTVVYWGAGNLYVPILALALGLGAVASFRAVENLFLPMSQVLTALGTLLLPQAARCVRAERPGSARKLGVCLCGVMSAVTLAYCLVILGLGPRLLRILYGDRLYSSLGYLIPFFCALLLIRAASDSGLATTLRALGRPEVGFWSNAAGSAVNLTIGLLLVYQFGVPGALSGWVLSALLQAGVVTYFFTRLTQ